MIKNKLKIALLVLISFITYSNFNESNITELQNKFETYNKKISELKNTKEDLSRVVINEKYGIISGKNEATLNISTIFKYYKTSTYEIFTKPNYTTAIKLNNDENIVYVGGGNTEDWNIDSTKGGNDASEIIFIKPLFDNLKTNLTIITNKRSYFIYLQSTNDKYNPYIEFKYPYENQMKFETKNNNDIVMAVDNIDKLDFNYEYDHSYSISPVQIFNDGKKTILVMSSKLQEMPVVYGYTEDNQLSQVNYRVIENRIIIDKVLYKLHLVLGNNKLDIKQK